MNVASPGYGIDMNRDKEVGLGFVGNLSTSPQLHEHIRLACIDNLHVTTVTLDNGSKSQRITQRQVFLFRNGTNSTRVMSTVTSINDHHKLLVGSTGKHCATTHYPKEKKNLFAHI